MVKYKLMAVNCFLLTFLCALFSLQCPAQAPVAPISMPEEALRKHVFTLASDSLQGRETGTIGLFRAADYCVAAFKNAHLLPVFPLDSGRGSFLQKYYFTADAVTAFGNLLVYTGSYGGGKLLPYKRYQLVNAPAPNADNPQLLFAHNVGGLLPGTDLKNEIVVISAHYDHLGRVGKHIFNGADDNASGTAAVLAIAAAFDSLAQQGIRPRRSMLFVLFSGEEGGLVGSNYFVNNSPFAMSQLICDLNVDMVGRTDLKHRRNRDYCYVITGPKNKEMRRVIDTANQQTARLLLDDSYDSESSPSGFFYRSDHYNFAKQGIPIAFFLDGGHTDYHQPSDSADKINYPLLQKRATLVFQTAWLMANPKE